MKRTIAQSIEEQNRISKELENFENEIDKIDSTEEDLRKQVRIAKEYFEDCNAKVERVSKEIRTIKIELDEEIKYSEEFEKKITNSNSEMEKIALVVESLKKKRKRTL